MSNGTLEFDLVIKNGKLVIPPDIISSSIGIKGEKIAAIATDLSGFPGEKNHRCQGKLRHPGRRGPGNAPWRSSFPGRRFHL